MKSVKSFSKKKKIDNNHKSQCSFSNSIVSPDRTLLSVSIKLKIRNILGYHVTWGQMGVVLTRLPAPAFLPFFTLSGSFSLLYFFIPFQFQLLIFIQKVVKTHDRDYNTLRTIKRTTVLPGTC